MPGNQYTQGQHHKMKINPDGFLTPDEEKLSHFILQVQQVAFFT
jgi:hypothetical protein